MKRFIAWKDNNYEGWSPIEDADSFDELVQQVQGRWGFIPNGEIVYTEQIPTKVVDARTSTWQEVHNAT